MSMGEAARRRSATQKLIERFPDCCFCGGLRAATTREHMPPKSMFDGSHRPDKLVMPACAICNGGTSTADLTAAMVSRWDYYSNPREQADHARLAARVRRQAPELIADWTSLDEAEWGKARLHLVNHGVAVPADAGIATIGPLTIRQLNLFAHKVVLALYFEHFRRPLSNTGRVCAFWRTKEDFARDGIPKIFFELLPDYATLVQGQWNEHETFEYRHARNVEEGLFGCFARFRRGLFVFGFAAADATVLPPDDVDWIKPSDLLSLLDSPRFRKKA
jgi:hypothetical protein